MTSRDILYPSLLHRWGHLAAPVLRQFWMIALIVTVGALSSLAYTRMQAPSFEATAVVLAGPEVETSSVVAHLMSRDNLVAMALRHRIGTGENMARTAVALRQSIAVRDLTATAGATLGLEPQSAGIVVSVLWSDAETSARLANDLAQQVLDEGNGGKLAERQDDIDFYAREEQRLWQEVSALQSEIDALKLSEAVDALERVVSDSHRLDLMRDQYLLVRQRLAELTLDSRRAGEKGAARFSLLQRATSTDAVSVVRNWMLAGVAGSLLLAVALAFVLERRYPGLQRSSWNEFGEKHPPLRRVYKFFDDPEAPILGIPRFVVVSALMVAWLVTIAVLIG